MSKPVSVVWPDVPGVIREWRVAASALVKKGQQLAVCEPLSIHLVAPQTGIIKKFNFKKGDAIQASYVPCKNRNRIWCRSAWFDFQNFDISMDSNDFWISLTLENFVTLR